MNREIIIVQNKFDLVMRAVSKIIEINFKFSPNVIPYKKLKELDSDFLPKLLIIDKTVFSSEFKSEVSDLVFRYQNSKIIIITLDKDELFEKELLGLKDIEVINLWQRHNSIIDYLISIIKQKIKTIEVLCY